MRSPWSGPQQVVILADKAKGEMDVAVYETLRCAVGWMIGWSAELLAVWQAD